MPAGAAAYPFETFGPSHWAAIAVTVALAAGLPLAARRAGSPRLTRRIAWAIALALLVNELFSNAIAHGLAGQERGTVVVDTYLADGRVVLQVKDDGQGPMPGENGEGGLGLQIIRALVTRDLGGTFALQRDGEWTVAIVSFPYRLPHEVGESLPLPGPGLPH